MITNAIGRIGKLFGCAATAALGCVAGLVGLIGCSQCSIEDEVVAYSQQPITEWISMLRYGATMCLPVSSIRRRALRWGLRYLRIL